MSDLRQLKDARDITGNQFLTVRARQAWVSRKNKTLYVKLDWDSEILTSSKERQQHFASVSRSWFDSALLELDRGTNFVQIASCDQPLEVITGDVCLILVLEEKEYIVSHYRDIPPIGWVIPGGCPKSFEELFHPRIVATREACDEVLMLDAKGVVYVLGRAVGIGTSVLANFDAWGLKPTRIVRADVYERIFECARARDADHIMFLVDNEEIPVENVAVTIDPQIGSVTVTLYWRIYLPIRLCELRLFDGERLEDGALLNRPIRLAPVQGGDPVAIFQSGEQLPQSQWKTEWMEADWVTEGTRKQVTF